MAGFGSLLVARHSGIFSMSLLLLLLAVGTVLLATFTVLPLLLDAPQCEGGSTGTPATEDGRAVDLLHDPAPQRLAS